MSKIQNIVRFFIAGIIGGLLAEALSLALTALVSNIAVVSTHYNDLATSLLFGMAWGVFFASIYRLLPQGFFLHLLSMFATMVSIRWAILFPLQGVFLDLRAVLITASQNLIYATVLAFILRQMLDLALPMWLPSRRAEDFKDLDTAKAAH